MANVMERKNVNMKVFEYEGWSLNNTSNKIHWLFSEGNNALAFVLKDEISELELFGLESLLKHHASRFAGLDIEVFIVGATYNSDSDCIKPQFNMELYNSIRMGIPTITHASNRYPMNILNKDTARKSLDESQGIIYVYAITKLRLNTFWWKVKNPRVCEITNTIKYF